MADWDDHHGMVVDEPHVPRSEQGGLVPANGKCILCLALMILLVSIIIFASAVAFFVRDGELPFSLSDSVEDYVDSIDSDRIMEHLKAFQAIADANGGNRAAGLPGYDASVEYVVMALTENDVCEPQIQEFQIFQFEEVRPSEFHVVGADERLPIEEFSTMTYSGSGNVVGVASPPTGSPVGCNASDFSRFIPGHVAVVKRGECTFAEKATNAFASGAVGVVIFNEGTGSRMGVVYGTLGSLQDGPVFGTSYLVGESILASSSSVQLSMMADTAVVERTTANIICPWPVGEEVKTDKQIVVGSHLDSVPAGPGINDNGSGSATNLELAIQMAQGSLEIANQVVFCWWGAEEIGLLGSENYVESRRDTLDQIALNLNFDMTGSPNYIYGVYNGSDAEDVTIRKASYNIERLFVNYYESQELPYKLEPFTGRSDYGPFIEVGIPAGGLFTGAEVTKTEEERIKFGGLANAAYDPCYHKACDTVYNIDHIALLNNGRAAAYTLGTLSTMEDIDELVATSQSTDRRGRSLLQQHQRLWWKDDWM